MSKIAPLKVETALPNASLPPLVTNEPNICPSTFTLMSSATGSNGPLANANLGNIVTKNKIQIFFIPTPLFYIYLINLQDKKQKARKIVFIPLILDAVGWG